MNLKENSLMKIELSGYPEPTTLLSGKKNFVAWGKFNEYPEYLIDIYNKSAIHGAIVKGKSAYVYGQGLCYKSDSVLKRARADMFLERANRYENWNTVYDKTCKQFELFNGFAWQVRWNYGGKIGEVYCMELSKLRRSPDKKKVIYCDAWWKDGKVNPNPEKHPSYKEYDAFNPYLRTGIQVLYYRLDTPECGEYSDLYPSPDYRQGICDIETDIEISSFHFHNLKNGMFASAILSFFNGEPDDDAKKWFKKTFQNTHGTTRNTGKLIIWFGDKGGTAPDLKPFTPGDLDKMFEVVSKRAKENTFTAHRAHPVLFGVMTEGSLSDTSGEAVLKKWDQFNRAYVESRREVILNQIKDIAIYCGYDMDGLYVKPLDPVGVDVPQDPNVLLNLFDKETVQEIYAKKYGIELKAKVVSGEKMEQEAVSINENIKNLTGKQWINIKRVLREINNGKITKEAGVLMLSNGYGLTHDDIEVLLKTPETTFSKFAKDKGDEIEDIILNMFEAEAIDDVTEDEVINEQFFCSVKSLLKFQEGLDLTNTPFANQEELNAAVLEVLKGNPLASHEQIAKQLGIEQSMVDVAVKSLSENGYVTKVAKGYQPTGKAIEAPKIRIESYVVYAYVTRPDVPDAESGSRRFCERLMKMTRNGKRWTKESIDKISNEFGEDAWTYRGGFYTNPKSNITTPYCRHVWKGITKTRRVKS